MFGNVVALVWHSYLAWKTNPSIVPQGKPDGDIYNVKTSQLDWLRKFVWWTFDSFEHNVL